MSPPRVLYMVNGFNRGGAELGLKTMLEHDFLRGCEVMVFAIHEGAPELRAAIEGLLRPGHLVVASPGPRLTLAGMGRALLLLRRIVAEFRPGTVVLSLRQANIVGRSALLGRTGVRCIAFEHIARLERGRLTPLYAFLLKRLSGRVDEVWADCLTTLAGARRYYAGGGRQERVVPLFVAPRALPRKESYALHDPVRLVAAGRLIPRKRFDVLIRALALLHAQGIEAGLTVFGDGPDRARLETLAGDLGLARSIRFEGFQPSWFRLARDHDVCVQLSDEEGFCIVAAEAMMVGLPLIVSPVGGVLEYSTHGRDAIHAPEAGAGAVAALIAGLIGDEPRRRALGAAAAERIARAYGTEAARSHYADLTRAIAQSPAQAPA